LGGTADPFIHVDDPCDVVLLEVRIATKELS